MQRFFDQPRIQSSLPSQRRFGQRTPDEIRAHLALSRFGGFELTKAVRPGFDLQIIPRSGYRYDTFRAHERAPDQPVLLASATSERLLDLFLAVLQPLGSEVDVRMERRYHTFERVELGREGLELCVLSSLLVEFEDLLLHDGTTAFAVRSRQDGSEVQLDEHKLLVCSGNGLGELEQVLRQAGLRRDQGIRFLPEHMHLHCKLADGDRLAEEFQTRLGLEPLHEEAAA